VAGLMMHYVSALLPDKKHTFSMADAVTTLRRGSGDCTEHAVLYASLMRAARIPTRLVSGMQLTRGGMWGYHMWNSYWNGSTWRAIDPATMSYRPGALYVALGRGAARFDAQRDRLADFMWRTFSGVSFDLVEAYNEGEALFLARPRSPDQNLKEMALFNSVVLSERGDHDGAIALLDDNIPPSRRSLAVRMMRIELLVRAGRHDEALTDIVTLRDETSDPHNVKRLDNFELKCLLTIGESARAEELYRRIDSRLAERDARTDRILLEAELRAGSGERERAIAILKESLAEAPHDADLSVAYAEYVSGAEARVRERLLPGALDAARRAVEETLAADARALAALARVLILEGALAEAHRILDHALLLAPSDRNLHELRASIPSHRCPRGGLDKK
jgi:tetratricopeptide (TPR) repeat protein